VSTLCSKEGHGVLWTGWEITSLSPDWSMCTTSLTQTEQGTQLSICKKKKVFSKGQSSFRKRNRVIRWK